MTTIPHLARRRSAPRGLTALLLTAPLALSLAACGGGYTKQTPFDAGRAWNHVETMVGFGPRPAGSAQLKKQADWLVSELKGLGLDPKIQEFTEPEFGKDFEGKPITFRNVHVVVPGSDPEGGPYIVIGAHYDSKLTHGHQAAEHNFEFVGAIDGAGASAVNLELVRVLTQRNKELLASGSPPYKLPNLWFVWFDGEESLEFDWNHKKSLFGSRHFVEQLGDRKVTAMILPDLIGDKDIKIDRDPNSNGDLQDTFEAAAKKLGAGEKMYKYAGRPPGFTDDHLPFREVGIPVCLLIDFEYRIPASRRDGEPAEIAKLQAWWHTPEDTMDKMSAASLQFVGDLIYTGLPEIEQSKRTQRLFR